MGSHVSYKSQTIENFASLNSKLRGLGPTNWIVDDLDSDND